MKRLSLLLALLFTYVITSAQEFIINPWGADELQCYAVTKSAEGFSVNYNKEEGLNVADGTIIQKIAESDNGYYYIFEHEGKYYAADRKELKFSDNNPEDVENPLSAKIQARGSALGNFYRTSKAITSIVLIMLVAAIIATLFVGLKMYSLRPLFLIIVPVAILAVSIIEVVGFLRFGMDMFWWCEYDRYGFFGSLFRVIPFMLVMAAQLFSIKFYELGLIINDPSPESNEEKKISVKPAFISLAICVPVFLVVVFTMAGLDLQGIWMDIAAIVAFLGSLGVGVLITLKRNIKAWGSINGLWVTIFTIVYCLGCIVSGIGLIALIFKIIFQMLVVIGAFLILAFITPRRRYVKDGRVYEEY